MENKFEELHRLCRRNELIQQKLWGLFFVAVAIIAQYILGLGAAPFTFGLVTVGVIAFLKSEIMGEEE